MTSLGIFFFLVNNPPLLMLTVAISSAIMAAKS